MKSIHLTIILLAFVYNGNGQKGYPKYPKHMCDSLNKLKVDAISMKPTVYKVGFSFTNQRGEHWKLLEWKKNGEIMGVDAYRWWCEVKWLGITTNMWTDDCWIDVATKKAYLNEQTHKIIYYTNPTHQHKTILSPIKHLHNS